MYKPVKVHIPEKVYEKLKALLIRDKVIPIKINLIDGNDVLLLTPSQVSKMEHAKKLGKKSITLRFSRRQVRANVKHEGGFLATLMSMATKVLPNLYIFKTMCVECIFSPKYGRSIMNNWV